MSKLREILTPDIGDFDSVEVIDILVKPGDAIKPEDPLLTLESDKATLDIPSPATGIVRTIKVKKGDKVSEGTPILEIEETDAVIVAEKQKQQAEESQPPPPPVSQETPPVHRPAPSTTTGSALVVLKTDVMAFTKAVMSSDRVFEKTGGFALPEIPPVDFSRFGPVEIVPLTRLKKIGGQHLHRSWINVPHVTQFDEADITALEELRKAKQKEAEQHGVKLTLLSFLIKAVVAALKKYPEFNASLNPGGDELTLKKYFHIGFAVNTDTGLIVPVVKDADQKGLFDLARELGDLAQQARDKKLTPTQMQGGCFTISSLGHIGGTGFTPIVNVPEVAILGVARSA
ncbi:MAG: Dihydrolipoamide acetyltransferase component of pyruvate dehydrogenase complex, partial [Gammaproteobacteria bacterium]|nr:Dihydrolipoamide acetyltransferase component of pyruvate dehydrogenase complex [Gammaproteobacteria bacterium]